jgi:hypothetical protein
MDATRLSLAPGVFTPIASYLGTKMSLLMNCLTLESFVLHPSNRRFRF